MFTSIPYDVAGPGTLVAVAAFSVAALILLTIIISVAEAVVMFLLKWGSFVRSLLASLLMNVTSTIFGGVLVVVGFYSDPYLLLAIGFVLSVVIEGGVLMLMKRDSGLRNWIVSLVANSASYLLILLPIILLNT